MENVRNKCLEAIKKYDPNIFFKYSEGKSESIKKELNNKYKKLPLNYIGEIITFLFYVAIGFLILSFFAKIYHIPFISWQTVLVIFLSYILGYKNWAHKFSKIASKNIFHNHLNK